MLTAGLPKKDYHHSVINSAQLVNGLWMGTILLILGLVPGILDQLTEALSRFSPSGLARFPAIRETRGASQRPIWLAGLGMAMIASSVLAYLSN